MVAKKTTSKTQVKLTKTSSARAIPNAAERASGKATARPKVRQPEALGNSARVDVGDGLPDAILEDQRGKSLRIASLRGRPAVVYFYPKDDTPGCTREACAFQEQLSSLSRLGAKVVGISPDPGARHAKFAEKYGLEFTLLVDAERNYAKSCGVLVPKTLYGKTSIGIERTTYLLDARAVIRQLWRKVKVDGHVDQVLLALRTMLPK